MPATTLAPLDAFAPTAVELPDTDELFIDIVRHFVQNPYECNDYKKTSGSSDGAKTYDTTAT
jgi:hypothetical protein